MRRCPTCKLPRPRAQQSLKRGWTVKRCRTCGLITKVIKTKRRRVRKAGFEPATSRFRAGRATSCATS